MLVQGRPSRLRGGILQDLRGPLQASMSHTMCTSPWSLVGAEALPPGGAEACCPKVRTSRLPLCVALAN